MSADPTERFRALVQGPEEALDLDVAALLVAAHRYPDLDVAAYLGMLDVLASACPEPTLAALRHHLYGEAGFAGNRADYYDPRNSFLNDVLSRRTGIPITLAIVVMATGRRLGIDVRGIGMPGHFLVAGPFSYLDPFDGVEIDEHGAVERYEGLRPGAPFRPEFLAPVGPRAIVSRLLANLQAVFFSSDLPAAGWVVDLRLAIPGLAVPERRALAQALASLGRFDAAADELLRLRDDLPESAALLEQQARSLRARTN